MKRTAPYLLIVVVALSFGATSVAAQELDKLEKPAPVVPEIFTIEGEFVRIAYNNEGFVSLGYKVANTSVAEEWLLLEMGVTVQRGNKGQTLERGALSLQLPDGSTVGLPSQKEFRKKWKGLKKEHEQELKEQYNDK